MPLSARSCVLIAAIALAVCVAYDQLGAGVLRKPQHLAPHPIFGKAAA